MSTAQHAAMTAEQAAVYMAQHDSQSVRQRLGDVARGHQTLDCGCGPAFEIAEYFDRDRYFGIDVSEELVKRARTNNPGFDFAVMDGRDLVTRWPRIIIKSVLEHVPPDEAQALYEVAREHSDVLYVAWHTEPKHAGREHCKVYQGELGEMEQWTHDRSRFAGVESREHCGPHTIWRVV